MSSNYSTNMKLDKKLIPLNHIDNGNVSIRNLEKIELIIYKKKLRKEIEFNLEIDGEFPTYISAIDFDRKKLDDCDDEFKMNLINKLNINAGDFVFAINGKNVSRASKKSVQKMIK